MDLIDLPKCRYCGALATSNGPQGEPICAECPPMAEAEAVALQEEAAQAQAEGEAYSQYLSDVATADAARHGEF